MPSLHDGVPSLFHLLSFLLFFRYAVQLEARSGASILLRRLDTLLSASSPEGAPDMPALDVWAAAATKAAILALARQVGTLLPAKRAPKFSTVGVLSFALTGTWEASCVVYSESARRHAVVHKALLEVPDKGYGRIDVAYLRDSIVYDIAEVSPLNVEMLKLEEYSGEG